MDEGRLVSDDIVSGVIGDALDKLAKSQGVIFDGYPRTELQVRSLDDLLAARDRTLDFVIELAVDEDALVERITGRFSCTTCNSNYHDTFRRPKVAGSATSAAALGSVVAVTTMKKQSAHASPNTAQKRRRSCRHINSEG